MQHAQEDLDHSTIQKATNTPYVKFAVDTDADPLLWVCGVSITLVETKSLFDYLQRESNH